MCLRTFRYDTLADFRVWQAPNNVSTRILQLWHGIKAQVPSTMLLNSERFQSTPLYAMGSAILQGGIIPDPFHAAPLPCHPLSMSITVELWQGRWWLTPLRSIQSGNTFYSNGQWHGGWIRTKPVWMTKCYRAEPRHWILASSLRHAHHV